MKRLGCTMFADVLLNADNAFVITKLGVAPAGSVLAYQQEVFPPTFESWISESIMLGMGQVCAVEDPPLFECVDEYILPTGTDNVASILKVGESYESMQNIQ